MTENIIHWQHEIIEECSSTNLVLKSRCESTSVAEGHVLIAKKQTAGLGRLQREWISPPGNLAFSIVLDVPKSMHHSVFQTNLLAGLAVFNTVKSSLQDAKDLRIKWPNDIYIRQQKISGILSEFLPKTHQVIIGVGINVNSTRTDFPPQLQTQISTLRDESSDSSIDPTQILNDFLRQLDHLWSRFLLGQWPALRDEIQMHLLYRNQPICFDTGQERICGVITGIAHDGALLIQVDQQTPSAFYSGDVITALS